jgi:hypothetical protein
MRAFVSQFCESCKEKKSSANDDIVLGGLPTAKTPKTNPPRKRKRQSSKEILTHNILSIFTFVNNISASTEQFWGALKYEKQLI